MCRDYAVARDWDITEVFSDEAISGAGADRPGLAALIEASLSDRKPFDAVLVDDTSRLSRRLADSISIFERLNFAGVRIIAVSQGIDSSSDQADVLVTVHGLVDSLYIKELGKKTHRGLDGQILRGMHAGGRCFGYRSERVDGGVRVIVEPGEAKIVERIFEMSAAGMSLKKIAKKLNAENVPTARPRAGKHYATWCPSAIRAMLRNEMYAGRLVWNRSHFIKRPGTNKRISRPRPQREWRILERPDLRIVSDSLWSQVHARQARLKEIYGACGGRGGLNRAASSPYLLTGLLKCGTCGANLIIVLGKGARRPHKYYGCPQHFHRGACANGLTIRLDLIESMLFERWQHQVLDPEIIEYTIAEFGRLLRAKLSNISAELAAARGRKQQLEEELKRLAAAIAESGLYSRFLIDAIATREKELSAITETLVSTRPHSIDSQIEELRKFVISRLANIQELLKIDVDRARANLAKHVTAIRLVAQRDENGKQFYIAEGEWDLFGDFRMVAGEGFEPSTFGL